MIHIRLSRLLGERRMTQKDLSRKTGIRENTINDMYHDMSIMLRVEYLDRICRALGCDISDLLEYVPNEKKNDLNLKGKRRGV